MHQVSSKGENKWLSIYKPRYCQMASGQWQFMGNPIDGAGEVFSSTLVRPQRPFQGRDKNSFRVTKACAKILRDTSCVPLITDTNVKICNPHCHAEDRKPCVNYRPSITLECSQGLFKIRLRLWQYRLNLMADLWTIWLITREIRTSEILITLRKLINILTVQLAN